MNNTNGLISGDNKGHASYLMEKCMNKGALPGQVSYKVHVFAMFPRGYFHFLTQSYNVQVVNKPTDKILQMYM